MRPRCCTEGHPRIHSSRPQNQNPKGRINHQTCMNQRQSQNLEWLTSRLTVDTSNMSPMLSPAEGRIVAGSRVVACVVVHVYHLWYPLVFACVLPLVPPGVSMCVTSSTPWCCTCATCSTPDVHVPFQYLSEACVQSLPSLLVHCQ